MSSDPTRDELLEEVKSLRLQLEQQSRPRPHVQDSSERTVVSETPRQTTISTTHVPPTQQQFERGVIQKKPLTRRGKDATPEQIVARITEIKTVIASGVEGAGYGDKRTDFRSLNELRQILNGLEEDLADALGIGGRVRQIRMTTSADKGL